MLRYRIAKDPRGRYFVLPVIEGIVPLEETYSNRAAAQQTAEWCNRVRGRQPSAAAGLAQDVATVPIQGNGS